MNELGFKMLRCEHISPVLSSPVQQTSTQPSKRLVSVHTDAIRALLSPETDLFSDSDFFFPPISLESHSENNLCLLKKPMLIKQFMFYFCEVVLVDTCSDLERGWSS